MRISLLWLSLGLGFVLIGCDDGADVATLSDAEPITSSCQSDEDCPDGRCSNGVCMDVDCFTNDQCGDGMRCVNYQCEAEAPECITDVDCGDGMRCEAGACVAVEHECDTHEDCAEGQCVDHQCVFVDPFCFEDGDCEAGLVCVDGICQEDTTGCVSDEDCQAGESCEQGVCEPLTVGCMEDDDCGPLEVCVDQVCLEAVECAEDTDCDAGELCVEGACVLVEDECLIDEDCDMGFICVEAVCVRPEQQPCADDTDCAAGFICLDGLCDLLTEECVEDMDCGEGAFCLGGVCYAQGDECMIDGDCEAGLTCFDGFCLPAAPECIEDLHCGVGMVCDDFGLCVDEMSCEVDEDCAPGEVCVEGACAPVSVECAVDSDCGEGFVCEAGVCLEAPPECVEDADCGLDFACELGECVPVLECVVDEDCAAGFYCDAGDCAEIPPECVVDGDCAAGFACVAGACAEIPPECVVDGDCAAGFACVAGACAEIPPECVVDGDCAAGFACVEGACLEIVPECVVDADCDMGFACVEGVCAEIPPECAVDGDCAAGLVCDLGVCVEPPPECVVDEDCAAGFACELGACVAIPPECVMDIDCGEGMVCAEGVCVPWVQQCAQDSDCDVEQICLDGLCQAPECAVDADCAVNEVCAEGACVVPECDNDMDCAPGLLCQHGACVPPPPECFVDLDCGEGLICEQGFCVAIPPECAVDADCAEGDVCAEGRCFTPPPECDLDADCPNGEVCVAHTCQPFTPECVADADCAATQVCFDGVCMDTQGEDACALGNVFLVEGPGVYEATTVDAPAGYRGSCGGAGPEVVAFVAFEQPMTLCITTQGYDAVLYARTVCAEASSEVACNDDAGDISTSQIQLDAAAETPYFIFVDSFGEPGAFTIEFAEGPCDVAPECVADEDCGPGFLCVEGLCQETPPECFVDEDCGPGFLCINERCEPIQPECFTDEDCGPGFLCEQGLCQEIPPECFVDEDCGPGLFCDMGVCQEIPPECFADEDCGMGFACVNGACQEIPPECVMDADCAPGLICFQGVCQEIPPECVVDADCAPGFLCQQGLCVEQILPNSCDEDRLLFLDHEPPFMGDTTNGLSDHLASCGNGAQGPEQVYAFRLAPDFAEAELCAMVTGYDTVLHVREGDCLGEGAEIACDDDGLNDGNGGSMVRFMARPDVDYFLFVDSFELGGAYELNIGLCDPNPICEVDEDCGPGFLCQAGQCVEQPQPTSCDLDRIIPLDQPPPYSGDTANGLASFQSACGGEGPEIVYGFSWPDTEPPIELCALVTGFDAIAYVREGDCGMGAEISCDDNSLEDGMGGAFLRFTARPGLNYFLFVDGAQAGAYEMQIGLCPEPQCQVDADCGPGLVCVEQQCIVPQPNACDPAQFAPLGLGENQGSTAGQPNDHGASCGDGAQGAEDVYPFAVGEEVEICASVEGYDTVLHVRQGDCFNQAAEVACNDDDVNVPNNGSAVRFTALPGVDYFLFVDGYNPNEGGDYVLRFDACPPLVCEGDADCAPGEVCIEGRCVAGPQCVVDADCAPGEVCQQGECAPFNACLDGQLMFIDHLGRYAGSTIDQPNTLNSSCGGNGPEDVYAVSVGQPMALCLKTTGYDTVMHIRQDVCEELGAEIACDDDGGLGTGSALRLDAEPGVAYFIAVDSYADGGEYFLDVDECPEPPQCVANADCGINNECINGICAAPVDCMNDGNCPEGLTCNLGVCVALCQADAECGAFEICEQGMCVNAQCVLNADCGQGMACLAGRCIDSPEPNSCDQVLPIDHLGDYQGDTSGALASHTSACRGVGPEQIYVFSVAEPTAFCVTTVGYDTVLHARTDCMNDGAEIACNDDAPDVPEAGSFIRIDAVPNVPYFIFVDSYYAAGGAYTMTFDLCPPDPQCAVNADCAAGEICDQGQCVAATACAPEAIIPIDHLGRYAGSTIDQLNTLNSSCGNGGNGPEDVYAVSVGLPMALCFKTTGYDTVMHIRQNVCEELGAEIACNDDGGLGNGSALRLDAEPDVAYFIAVDSFGAGGEYFLDVDECPEPPQCVANADCGINNECINGICAAPVDCMNDGNCPEGLTCDLGVCVAPCQADAECGELEMCEQGMCVGIQCFLNTDCGQGMACLTGRCIESPGPSVCDAPIIMDHIGDYQGVTDGASTL
ncbi:hypothetical protein KKF91_11215, partial [Myxococcota bacterium]|nr:hypothetical protein [Myxococcota bacterium]